MLASRMPPPKERAHGSIYHYLERGFELVESGYRRALDWTLSHQWTTLAIALASFAATCGLNTRLDKEFFPPTDRGMFFSNFDTPPGTALKATSEILDLNEKYVMAQPEIVGLFEAVGMGGRDGVARANEGIMFATLKPMSQRKRTVQQVIDDARKALGAIPGQNIRIFDPSSMQTGGGAQFEVMLRGNLALADLDAAADKFIGRLREHGGFVDLDKSLKLGLPELRIVPDREKAAELGVDAATLSQVVQLLIGGLEVGQFKDGGHRFDIRMRLEQDARDTPDAVDQLYVRGMDGKLTSLRNLVHLQTDAAPSVITRSNRQRSVTVSANLPPGRDRQAGAARGHHALAHRQRPVAAGERTAVRVRGRAGPLGDLHGARRAVREPGAPALGHAGGAVRDVRRSRGADLDRPDAEPVQHDRDPLAVRPGDEELDPLGRLRQSAPRRGAGQARGDAARS